MSLFDRQPKERLPLPPIDLDPHGELRTATFALG